MTESPIRRHLLELARTATATADSLAGEVDRVARRTVDALRAGRTLFFCGNGGSAADAQHLAAEYVVRYARTRGALPALALTVDTSILTAGGNDFGFDEVFARQVEALGRPGDVLFLHSTSGRSANLIRAAETARARGMTTVAFLARDGGPLRERVDVAVVVPTEVTAHAQEIHLALGHAVCDIVDRLWAEEGAESVPALLEGARRAEKAQTAWYRALAVRAGEAGDEAAAERFNELLADEQHHLSRLTARLLELGGVPAELPAEAPPALPEGPADGEIRAREAGEVERYRRLLEAKLDPDTRGVIEEILESERQHERTLGGKWMPA